MLLQVQITHLSICEMPIKLDLGIPLFADHNLEDLSTVKTEMFTKPKAWPYMMNNSLVAAILLQVLRG